MRLQLFENGHVLPLPEHRNEFAYDLRETVRNQMFAGYERVRATLGNGGCLEVKLPNHTQLLDFTTIERGSHGTLEITVLMPSTNISEEYLQIGPLNYVPPNH